jgi:hemerythrin superfamily protein
MDITDLVLNDHHRQRQEFAVLDDVDPTDTLRLAAVWGDLANFLELHAAAEEEVLYPEVLKHSDPVGEETKDAIGDHNKIRDAIAAAMQAEVASEAWWDAVGRARAENTEHMGEEEDDVLPPFRRRAPLELRAELGIAFEAAKTALLAPQLDEGDKDPDEYVQENT